MIIIFIGVDTTKIIIGLQLILILGDMIKILEKDIHSGKTVLGHIKKKKYLKV